MWVSSSEGLGLTLLTHSPNPGYPPRLDRLAPVPPPALAPAMHTASRKAADQRTDLFEATMAVLRWQAKPNEPGFSKSTPLRE